MSTQSTDTTASTTSSDTTSISSTSSPPDQGSTTSPPGTGTTTPDPNSTTSNPVTSPPTSPPTLTGPLSTSSTTTTTSSSSSSSSTSQSTSTTVVTSETGGNIVTRTSSVIVTPSRSVSSTPTAASQPKGFFQNTGAVAATFTVVGLVALGIIILAVTQTIRRRRAKRFDREIAEAAREAATAPVPVFLDDEDDNYGPGYSQGPAAYNTSPSGGYSDVSSHGTYGQPPMSHESYPMSERTGPGPGPGQFFDHNNMYGVPTAAGAAGIGVVRARSTRDPGGYAAALNEGGSPYPAFANSHPQYDMYNGPANMGMAKYRGPGSNEGHDGIAMQQQPMYRGPGSNEGHDGMSLGAAGAVPPQYTGHSSGSDLSRMKSNGSRSLVDGYYPSTTAATAVEHPNESYASYYQPGFDPANHQPYDHPHNLQPGNVSNKAYDSDGAYGGYTDDPSPGGHTSPTPGLPNPFAADKGDESGEEDSGEDGGRRVLKVANN